MLRIPETERKLREVAFFLGHLRLEQKRADRLDSLEAFGHYLSAFLSAGRSVTFVLQSETGGGDRYRQWYEDWLQTRSPDERSLLKFMNDQRVEELKKRGSETMTTVEMIPLMQYQSGQPYTPHPAHSIHWFAPPGTPPPQIGVAVRYFEGNAEKVVDRCARYAGLLNELVNAYRASQESNGGPGESGGGTDGASK